MFRLLSTLLLITITFGCKKEKHQPEEKKPLDLLTDGKWLLKSFGYDYDNSGQLDDNENLLEACYADNTTQYFTDGSGETLENQTTCQNSGDSEFEWKFIDDEKAIEILFQRYELITLTEKDLRFKLQIPGLTVAAFLSYKKQ
jgi:hypothetical protein